VHAQTLAVYRLLDALRERHAGVEIESCSSGGARADLGVLARTDRIWASDTNDALECQSVQRLTSPLLPGLFGSHVGQPVAHTTGRTGPLPFRVATALFGHFGFEWDRSGVDAEERALLAEAVTAYRRLRGTLHTGDVVHDLGDRAGLLHGVVAADGMHAVYCYAQLMTSPFNSHLGRARRGRRALGTGVVGWSSWACRRAGSRAPPGPGRRPWRRTRTRTKARRSAGTGVVDPAAPRAS